MEARGVTAAQPTRSLRVSAAETSLVGLERRQKKGRNGGRGGVTTGIS